MSRAQQRDAPYLQCVPTVNATSAREFGFAIER